ncbi:hypothetical protein, partial [Moorena sp. SIO4A5]|uniref:hypothetical protein n=1 Tax=Moorena sp. SIO4A5 TaxID=2607838 RepID=UPI0013C73FB8
LVCKYLAVGRRPRYANSCQPSAVSRQLKINLLRDNFIVRDFRELKVWGKAQGQRLRGNCTSSSVRGTGFGLGLWPRYANGHAVRTTL